MGSEQQGWNISFPAMTRHVAIGLYVLAITVFMLGTDVVFRDQILERLVVRVGILLVSVALYLRFLKHP